MKILKITAKGLALFSNELVIDFTTLQRIRNDKNEMLYEISSKIHQNSVLAFIGINASGKTMTLKVLSFIIQMLKNEPINKIKCNDVLHGIAGNEQITIETYFSFAARSLYKMKTIIQLDQDNDIGNLKFLIKDEMIWKKEISKIKTKISVFDFSEAELIKARTGKEEYLPNDVSIVIALKKEENANIYATDGIDWTNFNYLRLLPSNIHATLALLDASIEYLTFDILDARFEFRLKFFGKEEVILSDIDELHKYLSSGTIKGLNVFTSAAKMLKLGGYLIVDELENHFNHEIAATLIRLFMDKNINLNGAVIIFSTHYAELLDEFERADNIYIVRNKNGIHVDNFSKLLKRSDLKKSEVYQSNYLHGTAPSYEAYMNLKQSIMNNGEKP
jgi:uncharacterized protein